jgi:hypothetical protein
MSYVLFAAAALIVTSIFWNVATVVVLRLVGVDLSLLLPLRLFRRETPEVLDALRGRTINTYVVISGLLLFACPLFGGILTYDYVIRRYVQHSPYNLACALTSAAWLVLLVALGTWLSLGHWQRSQESGIGLAMLVIVSLKASTDLTGSLTAVVFLVAIAGCCSFVYYGIRRIRGSVSRKQSLTRRDTKVQREFVSEPFVPSKNPTAEKVAIFQKVMASGVKVASPPTRSAETSEGASCSEIAPNLE